MKKIIAYLRDNSASLLFFALLCAIVACLLCTADVSRRQRDLEMNFFQLESALGTRLDSIDDKLHFLSSWAMEAPSVTLGDTYINQADNSKSFVNSKGKGNNNSK